MTQTYPYTPESSFPPPLPPPAARPPKRRILAKVLLGGLGALIGLGTIGYLTGDEQTAQKRVDSYLDGEGQKEFFAADLQFRATFPSVPERSEQAIDADGANLLATTYMSGSGDHAFGVSGFGLGVDRPFDLTYGVNGAAAAINGTVVSSALTTFQGFKAAEFLLDGPQGMFVKGLIVRAPTRVYQVQVISKSNPPTGYDQFLQSFNIAG
jgi:hypothetical protein